MPIFFAFILLLLPLLNPPSLHAQTPTLGFFTRSPWPHPFVYPCNINTSNDNISGFQPEFHPLRPYPGNPCDPLIPRKDPEAPLSTDPDKQFLTFNCAKSLNVSGMARTKDVVNICGVGVMPANPLLTLSGSQDTSDPYRCDTSTYDICFVKRISWAINIDLSASVLPFSGNTEVPLEDPIKVNSYISWYLNGTINQSEQLPLDTYSDADNKRITSYSGPLNKLYPKLFRDPLKQTLSTTGVNTSYHNYLVACQRNVDLAYVREVLEAVLDLVFGNIFDSIRIAEILMRVGIDNLSLLGSTLVSIASLPFDEFNIVNVSLILANFGFDAIANDASAVNDLITLGRGVVSRIGYILQTLRTDMAESCQTSDDRHRLDWVGSNPDENWIKRYVPYSSLEDTTSEITVSVIPSLQPLDIDGTIIAIGMGINLPTDSRLYFPHFRSAVALSKMLNALHQPMYSTQPQCSCEGSGPFAGVCGAFTTHPGCLVIGRTMGCSWACTGPVPTPTPAVISYDDAQLVSQQVTLHQGLADSTLVQGEDRNNTSPPNGIAVYDPAQIAQLYSGGRLIRNTEMREGYAAPAPLYTPVDPVCDILETRSNAGDQLLGKEVNGTLTYYQLFRHSPQQVIDCAGGCSLGGQSGSTLCVTQPCVEEGDQCSITSPTQCCTDEIMEPYPGFGGEEGNCPWTTECEHADADFVCVNNGLTCEQEMQTAGWDYAEAYPYSCADRTGSTNGTPLCCGPRAAPIYGCEPKGSATGCFSQNAGENSCSYSTQLACESAGPCSTSPDGNCCYWSNFAPDPSLCISDTQAGCNTSYCDWGEVYPGHTIVASPPICPAWPETSLRSAARVHPFTKTPLIEKIYDLLVVNPQSLLSRWLPQLPLSATSSWEIKTGRENTIPATTVARYTATTDDLENTNTSGGRGGGGALYFPHVGSLVDHILGMPTRENLNLQRLLRPKGFVGWVSTASTSGTINCNTNVPDQNFACVNKDNYIDVAKRWTSMPEGTHAELCFNDVVLRASEAGVNPGLSLLIWLNESDTSNYMWSTPVEDFGVHTGQYNTPNDFNTQITGHLLTVNAYRTICASAISQYGGCRAFSARYLGGSLDCTPTAATDTYCDGLQVKWSWIGGSCAFPFP